MRRFIIITLSIIVSIAILLWVLRDIPFNEVIETIQHADILWVLITFGFITLALITRGVRWWVLLDRRTPLGATIHMVNIAFVVNLLPLRAGEFARSLIATRYGVPFMTGITSIVVERMIDVVVAALLLAFSLAQLPDVSPEVTQTATIFGVLAVAGFVVLTFFAHRPKVAFGILNLIFRILPFLERLPLRSMLQHTLDGLQPLVSWRIFLNVMLWSAIAWTMSLLSFYALFRALVPPDSSVDLILGTTLAISLSSFSIALPMTVAGIGPFQVAFVVTGDLIGMGQIASVSMGLLTHAMTILAYTLWGILGLIILGVSPAMLLRGNIKKEEDSQSQSVLSSDAADEMT